MNNNFIDLNQMDVPLISDVANVIGTTILLKNGVEFDYLEMFGKELISPETANVYHELKTAYLQRRELTRTPYAKENQKQVATSKTVYDLLNEPDVQTPFLWENIFPKGEFVGIVGKSGVNKSTFCRQLCLSIATVQSTFLDSELTPSYGKVLYCFSEEHENWIRHYLRKNLNGLEYEKSALSNMNVLNLENFETGADLLLALQDLLMIQKYDLIVMDSYSDFISKFGAKLNDNDTIRSLKAQIEFLKNDGCTVLFNHHTSDKNSQLGTFLGATAFKQIVRSLIEIHEDGNNRIISCEKNSYGAKFEPMVCELSENYLFVNTGKSISRQELFKIASNSDGNRPSHRPKIAPCDVETVNSVFDGADELTTSQIKIALIGMFAVSNATCERWIRDVVSYGFIEKTSHGKYKTVKFQTIISNQTITSFTFDGFKNEDEGIF